MKEINSLYIHFPFCQHLCNYCDFFKHRLEDKSAIKSFEESFLKADKIHQNFLKEEGHILDNLETLFIGGGTPSLWGNEGANFFKQWKKQYSFQDINEFTMEMNPQTVTEDLLQVWQEVGVNRFSFGVQSYNNTYLKLLDRLHRKETIDSLKQKLKDQNLNFSFDLMIGLPNSAGRRIQDEIESLCEVGPSHFSLYILTVPKSYQHYSALPDDHQIADEYLFVSEYLQSLGFEHYEVSNFALKGKKGQHNLNYWKQKSVAALGPSGTGFLKQSEKSGIRYKWKSEGESFQREALSAEEMQLEQVYLKLRINEAWELTHLDLSSAENLCLTWQERGLAKRLKSGWCLTPKGFVVLDGLMNELFQQES